LIGGLVVLAVKYFNKKIKTKDVSESEL